MDCDYPENFVIWRSQVWVSFSLITWISRVLVDCLLGIVSHVKFNLNISRQVLYNFFGKSSLFGGRIENVALLLLNSFQWNNIFYIDSFCFVGIINKYERGFLLQRPPSEIIYMKGSFCQRKVVTTRVEQHLCALAIHNVDLGKMMFPCNMICGELYIRKSSLFYIKSNFTIL